MIEVCNVSKYYGDIPAIDDISFTISKGEIIGFLGPNGAGKTTTMKILTCFMRPSKGSVKIGDIDIYDNPLEIKKMIGYLPESNPLYYDMQVADFLEYIAKLKEIPKSSINREMERSIEKCGLEKVAYRKIGNLSKGYKQRVGLAQAIEGDPPILILDEPTSGLDPNQIVEIRELIKELGKEKTVILSTHILPEVETTCNRILIISNGKLVADGTKEELSNVSEDSLMLSITVKAVSADGLDSDFKNVKGVSNVVYTGSKDNLHSFDIETENNETVRDSIFNLCSEKGYIIYELKKSEHSLEDIFKQLTLH